MEDQYGQIEYGQFFRRSTYRTPSFDLSRKALRSPWYLYSVTGLNAYAVLSLCFFFFFFSTRASEDEIAVIRSADNFCIHIERRRLSTSALWRCGGEPGGTSRALISCFRFMFLFLFVVVRVCCGSWFKLVANRCFTCKHACGDELCFALNFPHLRLK